MVGCAGYVVWVAQAMWWVAQAMWSGLRRLCGGIQVHNHATSWPNLQERTCKNSSQVEFQAGPEYSNTALLKYCIVTILY